MAAPNLVTLKSSDGEVFAVDKEVAFESLVIKKLIEEIDTLGPIPLENAPSEILAKVIDFCKYHVESRKTIEDKPAISEDEIKAWVEEFMKVDKDILFQIIMVANDLGIQNLCNECGRKIAYMIKGKTVEQIRKLFNIKDVFTPEEDAQYRRENAWAFEN